MTFDILAFITGVFSGAPIYYFIHNSKTIREFRAKHERDRKQLGEFLDEALTHMTTPGRSYTTRKAINDARNLVDSYNQIEIGFIDRGMFLLSLPKIRYVIDRISEITDKRIQLLNVHCQPHENCNDIRTARRAPYIELMKEADALVLQTVEIYEKILNLRPRAARNDERLHQDACSNFNNRDTAFLSRTRSDGGPERRRGYKNGPTN